MDSTRAAFAITRFGSLLFIATAAHAGDTAPVRDAADTGSSGATPRLSAIVVREGGESAAPDAAPWPDGPAALRAEFERDAAAIGEERKAAVAKLAKEYAARLEALENELNEQGRTAIAAAVRAEKARLEAGVEITEEMLSRAPYEVLKPRGGYLEQLDQVTHRFDVKAAQRAARYLGDLEKLAGAGEGDATVRALLAEERARLPQAALPEAARRTLRTPAAGGGGGGKYEEIAPDGALLTGLILHTGNFAGHHVIVAVQPIFGTAAGSRLGELRGGARPDAVKLEAAEGYAVGGINFHSGDRVDGLEILFMKIQPDRLSLDPADAYVSKWAGGKGGGTMAIGGSGNAIVGIYGGSGLELDSLGLIELLPPPDAKKRATSVKEVTRENPATVAVEGVTPEPLVASKTREAGKWRDVPEPLRGATILSVTANKHIGVAEYKVTAPGRVYLACNYDYQGNRSGDWTAERWMPEAFTENGWARVDGIELKSWEADRTFIIFTKELKAGETGRLRCNKYEPPYFITFAP
jgi:hypothetical protein